MKRISDRGIPVVIVERPKSGPRGKTWRRGCVHGDADSIAAMAAKELALASCQDFACVPFMADQPWNRERGETENAFDYLWRRGPQAKDEAWLKAERDKARGKHPLAEFAVVRDARTGAVLARYEGLDGTIEDSKGLYRRTG